MHLLTNATSFALVAGLLVMVPGLDTALVLRTSIASGRRAGIATAIGIATATVVWGALASVGIAALLATSRDAYAAVRVAGAAYLMYLGVRLLRSIRVNGESARSAAFESAPASLRHAPLRGLCTSLLNPKMGIFYVAMLPQFIPVGSPHFIVGVGLASIHALEGVLWFTILASAAQASRRWLQRARVRKSIDALTGSVLFGFGLKVAFSER